jgi:hypothetical protein
VTWYSSTGVPINAYKVYDPFCSITKSSSGAQSALGFQGQFTDAAAIELIQSGTPSPAIGQAINDAYNAINAAPTQQAIIDTAAAHAAAALAAQTAASTPVVEPVPATPQTPTPTGQSEAPGDPDTQDSSRQGGSESDTPESLALVYSAAPKPKVVNLLAGRGTSAPLVTFRGTNESGGISCSAQASASIDLVNGQIKSDGYIRRAGMSPPLQGSVGSGSISVLIRQITFANQGATFELEKFTGKQNNIPLVTDCVAGCLGSYEVTVKWTYKAPFDFFSSDFGCKAGEGFVACKKSYFVVNNQRSSNRNV